jgi:antirestriction protein ArdC
LEAHKARLDRDLKGRFGQAAYAAEELIAELGAAFLAAEFSFDGDVRDAGYIESWISLLRSDKRAFFTAANKAQAAAGSLHLPCLSWGHNRNAPRRNPWAALVGYLT